MDGKEVRELSVPYGTTWYRCESCTLGKRKGKWAFCFSGKVTPYEVSFETYLDFCNLDYKSILSDPPGDDVLQFLQKWGPLGLYYRNNGGHYSSESYYDHGKYIVEPTVIDKSSGGREVPLEDYWKQYHTRKYTYKKLTRPLPPYSKSEAHDPALWLMFRHDAVFDNYFETASGIGFSLYGLAQVIMTVKELPDGLRWYNKFLKASSLRPYLVQTSQTKYEWSFAFSNLVDALLGLHGQQIIGKVNIVSCEYCGNRFDTISEKRTRFCSDPCSIKFYNRQRLNDPFFKEKRKLTERARRRAAEIGVEEANSIKREISAAKNPEQLKVIERKYKKILEPKRVKRR